MRFRGIFALAAIACSTEAPSTASDASTEASTCSALELQPSPPVVLFVVQRSGSMAKANRWTFAAQGIVEAVDRPAFDDTGVGLLAVPSGTLPQPPCIKTILVACGTPAYAQTAPRVAGASLSTDPSGVRHDMAAAFAANAPDPQINDGNPLYAAIRSGIGILQSLDVASTRLLFVVTDGQIGCASLSMRPGFDRGLGCPDWEDPQNIVTLVQRAHDDPKTPVRTFVLGVPGADTYDATGVLYPPYHMRAALSSIAKAGAPELVPAGCNADLPFLQGSMDPATSCHFDFTQTMYSPEAVVDAIVRARSSATRCVYQLPPDVTPVSIRVGPTSIVRREAPASTCDACWDSAAANEVELFGTACAAAHTGATVSATFGCVVP